MKTIRRNSKQLNNIWHNAINGKLYTLDNCFIGENCNCELIKKEYEDFNFAKLWEGEPGKYTVHIHSNCFYHFNSITV